ncbi:hypothetical protein E4U43_005985 [Claviceps pusilla]|uniref:Uncharacterized protein n=1 Tax=Claviceps pusilla TaxID=123648 RepID=A0A9P7NGH2_9HYPO|nr:hypothetical protein E4U43_005985 [Claviceps pusilla]
MSPSSLSLRMVGMRSNERANEEASKNGPLTTQQTTREDAEGSNQQRPCSHILPVGIAA